MSCGMTGACCGVVGGGGGSTGNAVSGGRTGKCCAAAVVCLWRGLIALLDAHGMMGMWCACVRGVSALRTSCMQGREYVCVHARRHSCASAFCVCHVSHVACGERWAGVASDCIQGLFGVMFCLLFRVSCCIRFFRTKFQEITHALKASRLHETHISSPTKRSGGALRTRPINEKYAPPLRESVALLHPELSRCGVER